ncbi:MAG: hypothetical protein EB086_12705, partial [Rhodobacteraceae bacterium]|nr:hypothetical protein [Paracoccaceae bacterium]
RPVGNTFQNDYDNKQMQSLIGTVWAIRRLRGNDSRVLRLFGMYIGKKDGQTLFKAQKNQTASLTFKKHFMDATYQKIRDGRRQKLL